jgi:hypothetical protein
MSAHYGGETTTTLFDDGATVEPILLVAVTVQVKPTPTSLKVMA